MTVDLPRSISVPSITFGNSGDSCISGKSSRVNASRKCDARPHHHHHIQVMPYNSKHIFPKTIHNHTHIRSRLKLTNPKPIPTQTFFQNVGGLKSGSASTELN